MSVLNFRKFRSRGLQMCLLLLSVHLLVSLLHSCTLCSCPTVRGRSLVFILFFSLHLSFRNLDSPFSKLTGPLLGASAGDPTTAFFPAGAGFPPLVFPLESLRIPTSLLSHLSAGITQLFSILSTFPGRAQSSLTTVVYHFQSNNPNIFAISDSDHDACSVTLNCICHLVCLGLFL